MFFKLRLYGIRGADVREGNFVLGEIYMKLLDSHVVKNNAAVKA